MPSRPTPATRCTPRPNTGRGTDHGHSPSSPPLPGCSPGRPAGTNRSCPCPAPSTPAPSPAAPHQSHTAQAAAPPTPETGTRHAAAGRHAATTATTTAHAEPSHPSSPPAGPPAGGAAYPSPPANHGTSDTTTKTGPSPAAQSTPTPATAAPQDEQRTDSHHADQAQRTAHHDHARNTQRADQQRCRGDATMMQASVQVTALYQACTTSP